MTISSIKLLIDKQAAIFKEAEEYYEEEICEIIVFDVILDYCIENKFTIGHYTIADLIYDQENYQDEKWMIITKLYADMLSEENKLAVDSMVIELLNYYQDKFWGSENNIQI
jgi:hypothetical protein